MDPVTAPTGPALLRAIADRIEANPESHYQLTWTLGPRDNDHPCGTAWCIAGYAAMLHGGLPTTRPGLWLKPDGSQWAVDAWAEELLELDGEDADDLFSSEWLNGRNDEVPTALRSIAAGETRPGDWYTDSPGERWE